MRTVFLLIILFHGLIHLLVFVNVFGLKEAKEFTIPISKPMGVVWFSVTILFLTYGSITSQRDLICRNCTYFLPISKLYYLKKAP